MNRTGNVSTLQNHAVIRVAKVTSAQAKIVEALLQNPVPFFYHWNADACELHFSLLDWSAVQDAANAMACLGYPVKSCKALSNKILFAPSRYRRDVHSWENTALIQRVNRNGDAKKGWPSCSVPSALWN